MSDAQLACLLPACAALGVAAIFAAADLIERAVGGPATPVFIDEALHAIAGHALWVAFLIPALATGVVALALGLARRVRP